jgi:translation initiation factor IF-2
MPNEGEQSRKGLKVPVWEGITVSELSQHLGVNPAFLLKKLMDRGIFATVEEALDVRIATEITADFGASAFVRPG